MAAWCFFYRCNYTHATIAIVFPSFLPRTLVGASLTTPLPVLADSQTPQAGGNAWEKRVSAGVLSVSRLLPPRRDELLQINDEFYLRC